MPRALTPPHKLENFAVIVRAMGGNGASDQRAALNELYRRGLWLGPDQADAAIVAAGHRKPADKAERDSVLASLGYCPAPVPLDARPALPVIFRADWNSREGGAVHITAVFPTLPGNSDPRTATCYAHIGQHSACSPEWYRSTQRPATPEEYSDLLRELRGIYERDDDSDAVRLVIAKRWTRQHDDARRAEIRRTGRAA